MIASVRVGEPAVEAAVERDAGDDRDQDRRQRRDDGEQRDDADMQPRRRPPAPARDARARQTSQATTTIRSSDDERR